MRLRKFCNICGKPRKKDDLIKIMEDEWVHTKCFDSGYEDVELK